MSLKYEPALEPLCRTAGGDADTGDGEGGKVQAAGGLDAHVSSGEDGRHAGRGSGGGDARTGY